MLHTIYSVINDNENNPFVNNRKLVDSRLMPSSYLINKIRNSTNNNNFAEFLLSIIVSLEGKEWIEVHPEHLRLILLGLKEYKNKSTFNNLILEILEKSKII